MDIKAKRDFGSFHASNVQELISVAEVRCIYGFENQICFSFIYQASQYKRNLLNVPPSRMLPYAKDNIKTLYLSRTSTLHQRYLYKLSR